MDTWDEAKRLRTIEERGLDFADVATVFSGITITLPDERKEYGEPRFITAGGSAAASSFWCGPRETAGGVSFP